MAAQPEYGTNVLLTAVDRAATTARPAAYFEKVAQ
jgi:hypothetical protein